MPADDATGPTGRAAPIGFYANADDSPRVVSDSTRPSRDRPAAGPAVAAGAPRGSVVVVVLATLLLAGTAIGFAWTLTPAGRQTPDSGPATAPAQRASEAELQAPEPAPPPTVEVPTPAQPELAPHHRALAAQALKPAAHHPIRHAVAPRRHRAATDLADTYARAIAELDRRQAQAAGGDPPF
jgi:hypothetical protein